MLVIADINDTLTLGGCDPNKDLIDPGLRLWLNALCATRPPSLLLCTGLSGTLDDVLRRAPQDGAPFEDALTTAPAVFAQGSKYRDGQGRIHTIALSKETVAFRDGFARAALNDLIGTLRRDRVLEPLISVSENSAQKDNNGILFALRDHVININFAKLKQRGSLPDEKLNDLTDTIERATGRIAADSPPIVIDGRLQPAFRAVSNPTKSFAELVPNEITKAAGLDHALRTMGYAGSDAKADIVFIADDLKGNDRGPALLVRRYGGTIIQAAYGEDRSNVIQDPDDPACPDKVIYEIADLTKAVDWKYGKIMKPRGESYAP